jgi:predicted ATPase
MERFFVKANSVNAVRRALDRAPGGARVIGRFDRETIECGHTMTAQSQGRHWPVLLSRLEKAGLTVVDRPKAVELPTVED